jgi:hypothetical protein
MITAMNDGEALRGRSNFWMPTQIGLTTRTTTTASQRAAPKTAAATRAAKKA